MSRRFFLAEESARVARVAEGIRDRQVTIRSSRGWTGPAGANPSSGNAKLKSRPDTQV